MLILKASALQMRMDRVLLSEGFECFACAFGQTPSPVPIKALKGRNCIA